MHVMTKREELMSCQMSAFKDFIMQKRRDIADCSFEVENDVVSMAGSWVDNGPYINLPTGVKEARIKILFGSPCSEDKQEIIETFIRELINNIQRGMEKGGVYVYSFSTNFDFDVSVPCTFKIKYKQTKVKD